MSLQIECLAPLIPQNGHAPSPSTGVLVALTLSRGVFLAFSLDLTFAHLVPSAGGGRLYTGRHQRRVPLPLPRCVAAP